MSYYFYIHNISLGDFGAIQTTRGEIYIFTMGTPYKISSRILVLASLRTGIFTVKCACPETFRSYWPDNIYYNLQRKTQVVHHDLCGGTISRSCCCTNKPAGCYRCFRRARSLSQCLLHSPHSNCLHGVQ
jgi:hypothetical protein